MFDKILPALLALSLATAAAAETPKPVEAADLYRITVISDPQVAPDGKRILYMRSRFDAYSDRKQSELWLATLGAGGALDRRLLVGAASKPGGAVWSPDGARIAYVAESAGAAQLHVMTLGDGIGRPIASPKLEPGNLAWSRDGTRIAFTAIVEATPAKIAGMPDKPEGASWAPDPRIIRDFVYRTDSEGYRTPGYRHLFVVDADGKAAPRQVTKGDIDQAEDGPIAWSHDGNSLVVSSRRRDDRDLRPRDSDLYVIALADGAARQLTSNDGDEAAPVLSPDGRHVAFVGAPERPTFYVQPHIFSVPLSGGTPTDLSARLDREADQPMWSKDGRRIDFLYYDRGVARIGSVPARGGAVATQGVTVGGTRLYLPSSGSAVSCAAGTCAYPTLFDDRPAGLGVARGGREIASYDPNSEWRQTKRIGRMEAISYASSAGKETIQGWVLYPPDFDASKRYPLVLDIHGGPNIDYGPGFSISHALYAARGYIVLFTNPRGSIGYGERFANLIDKTYPSQDHDDLMSGVDALAARPYVDARNLFIVGGSGGGVLTTNAVGKTDRFRAAVALRPVTDWSIQALTSDLQSLTTRYWMADNLPWEKPEIYAARSTFSHVGKVKTPVMLITGEADYRTPIAQTEAYYQALKFRGIDTVMVRLPEAGHGMGRPSQWLQSILLAADWFDRYRVR